MALFQTLTARLKNLPGARVWRPEARFGLSAVMFDCKISSMQQNRVKFLAIGVGVIFLGGLLIGLLMPRFGLTSGTQRAYNTSTILRQVRTLSELVTVQYVMEKVVILEVPPESVLGQMFAGDNRVLLLAHGIVKAGVDLGKLQEGDITMEKQRIRIKLPGAAITDAYLDESQTRVIERTTGLFRTFDKNLEQSARQNAVDDIRRAARLGGIIKDAEERAQAQLRNLLEPMGLEVEFVSP